MKLSHSEMAEALGRLLYGKLDWLSRFASGKNKRADHDIERVQGERDALRQAVEDYKRAEERTAA